MNDLISRQALCDYALNQKDKSVTPNDIMRFPSADQWILCSKKLPKKRERVLSTIFTPHRGEVVRSGYYIDGAFYNDNGDCWMATDEEVLAWMPLPEPYKAESEHKE